MLVEGHMRLICITGRFDGSDRIGWLAAGPGMVNKTLVSGSRTCQTLRPSVLCWHWSRRDETTALAGG